MSSEMRELVKEMRAGTPCYVAKVGGGRCVNGAECLRCAERLDWADRLERALLARTEAGADGAAMLVRDVCEMAPADPDAPDTVCIRVSDLTRIAEQYTHPHDASEDAELNAAPVADGAVYQMMATDEDVDEDGNVRPDDPRLWMDHTREEYERLKDHPSVRSRIVYTHPQDASGDAEGLTAHGIKALDRCCGELRKFIELAGDYDLDEMSVQALETAIESMEMRKAAAMQAKEAK